MTRAIPVAVLDTFSTIRFGTSVTGMVARPLRAKWASKHSPSRRRQLSVSMRRSSSTALQAPNRRYFAQGPAGVGLFSWRDGYILNWQLSQYGSPAAYMRYVECAPFALLPRSTSPKLPPHRHPAPTLGSPVQSVGTVSIPSIHPPAMKPSRRPMWSRWARVTVSVSSDTTTVSIPQVRTWVQAGGTASVDISRSHPSA